MKVSLKTVQEVASILRDSSLSEIEITGLGEAEGQHLRLRRHIAAVSVGAPPDHATPSDEVASTSSEPASTIIFEAEDALTGEPSQLEPFTVRAMAVGIYRLPPSGLEAGAVVQARQVLGIIESLNIPSEVLAPLAGRVIEVVVEDGQGVGYDQPLMTLEPLPQS